MSGHCCVSDPCPLGPYDHHLCAVDPAAFAAGFAEAAWMVARWPRLCRQVHQLMTTHIGKLPWPVLGIFHETPHDEGLLLGICGLVALDALA